MVTITLQCQSCRTLEDLHFSRNQKFNSFNCPNCKATKMTVSHIEASIDAVMRLFGDHEIRINKLESLLQNAINECENEDN